MAFGNSSKKLSISNIWWFVWNFSEIFLDALVSSVLSLNFTETDSISLDEYSSLNNAKIKVESIPELRDIPILPVFVPISWEIFSFIDFSTNSSGFSSVCFSWKFSGSSFWDSECRLVE